MKTRSLKPKHIILYVLFLPVAFVAMCSIPFNYLNKLHKSTIVLAKSSGLVI